MRSLKLIFSFMLLAKNIFAMEEAPPIKTFTIVVLGNSKVGKSGLINHFFNAGAEVGSDLFRSKTKHCEKFEKIYEVGDEKIKLIIIDTPGFSQLDKQARDDDQICDDICQQITNESILLWVSNKFGSRPTKEDVGGLNLILKKIYYPKISTVGLVHTYCADGIPDSKFTENYKNLKKKENQILWQLKDDAYNLQLHTESRSIQEGLNEEYLNIWTNHCSLIETQWLKLLPGIELAFSYYDVDEKLPNRSEENELLLPNNISRFTSMEKMFLALFKDERISYILKHQKTRM